MPSPACEQAIQDALRYGKALLKYISPNDVGLTGGHQHGYYLPKEVWSLFTTCAPTKGINHDHHVEAIWQNGRVTSSTVKWYGKGTRREYRLTRFGKDFLFLDQDFVGSLLVLIPERIDRFFMYVLNEEDEIQDIQAALGIEVLGRWMLFDWDAPLLPSESEDDCMERHFRQFVSTLTVFPPTLNFANEARQALLDCIRAFTARPCDDKLIKCIDAEYRLFQLAERKICEPEIVRVFRSVDDFIATAQTILQRRKARAGLSLEHHVEYLLRETGIPFEAGVDVEGTKPDVLIPGKREYLDPDFPTHKLFVLGIKTTCKDRWRQVTKEAPRVQDKHLLTIQQGISPNQLNEMERCNISLVVPQALHTEYPPDYRRGLLTLEEFVDEVRARLAG